jgi:hypothetical protein
MLHFILKKNKQKESVDVTFYDLVELPTLLEFTNLLELNCSDNKLKLLPELPSTLRKSAFEMHPDKIASLLASGKYLTPFLI